MSAGEADKSGKLAPGAGAGSRTEQYAWTQRLQDVSVTVPVPAGTRGRDVTCRITRTHLLLRVATAPALCLDADFAHAVDPEECTWSVEDQCRVALELAKENAAEWWPCLLRGEPEIDVTQIRPEESRLSDLDPETRRMVEKMMYDQRQKAAGLPTSDEQERMRVFETFKAQHPEMDFSQAKFS